METVESYLAIGVSRVILGTAAVKNPDFLKAALGKYGEKIAVGVDLKGGFVAIKGWTETSELKAGDFFEKMQTLGVKTIICTDISRDGAMKGSNLNLYRDLSARFDIDLIASGGVSSMEDVTALAAMGLHGAIIGKAYYVGAVEVNEAVEAATGAPTELSPAAMCETDGWSRAPIFRACGTCLRRWSWGNITATTGRTSWCFTTSPLRLRAGSCLRTF